MNHHIEIEAQWNGEECQDKRKRIKHPGLDIAHKRRAAEIVGAPEGDVA